ncbi:MAG: flagellar hook-length control protein FliK, partial [Candidatus Eremiobacteraeota bacterium]|nr:flagellar hook-length control protein FliK [Candidatus Eremiobacteraeota bacterium]
DAPWQPQHVDANAVIDQLLRGINIRTGDGQTDVRLRLVPENLGDVSVKLVVSGGSVDASIIAHTADAQSALAGGQHQLAKALADAGLKLQSFTVGLAGDFEGNRDRARPQDSWNRSNVRRIGGLESVDTDEPADASLLAVPSFGPPIYAASPALRHLNYLV